MPGERLALARLADVPIAVEIMPEAQRMVDEADERWTAEHGLLADNPLLNEIEHATERLRENPQLGMLVRRGRFRSEIRRLLLRSGWHLYYRFQAERHLVEIIAVWFGSRGSGPPL